MNRLEQSIEFAQRVREPHERSFIIVASEVLLRLGEGRLHDLTPDEIAHLLTCRSSYRNCPLKICCELRDWHRRHLAEVEREKQYWISRGIPFPERLFYVWEDES
jgi:hypothetical protein